MSREYLGGPVICPAGESFIAAKDGDFTQIAHVQTDQAAYLPAPETGDTQVNAHAITHCRHHDACGGNFENCVVMQRFKR